MINLFKNTSSNWVRYDKYKWKEDKAGTLYITPAPDAQPSLYDPLKDSEQLVLKAVNLGDDTDTVAAIAGGLAGLLYGYDKIPQDWLHGLINVDYIRNICDYFSECA